jgi:regulator of sirC expression with transglutaminase-like and TPR domain
MAQSQPKDSKPRATEDLARVAREAVVFIRCSDREGDPSGNGSGFIVRADGIVATNSHVIGQGRPFSIQLASGKTYEPKAILGFDRENDLALVQIDAKELPTLPLGNSDELRPGQSVLAVGNPLGLRFSVSEGVVAEKREIDGRSLIQVAMPIEPGNSGSPLIDRQGRAVGVIAIKSLGSVGFAVPVNQLKTLLDRPKPVPIARWLTIGALNRREWSVRLGGEWRQRAGRILAAGPGSGFGGRTLCLSETPPPDGPFEISVQVKLEDESGAAGLAFHSDGGHNHYGFYPTNGSLRLTRFEGPDVWNWTILATKPSEHYRAGEWNTIKVRVDGPKLVCLVNDATVIEATDAGLVAGKIGLVKFRQPGAEFRHFRVGRELPPSQPSAALVGRAAELTKQLSRTAAPDPKVLTALAALGPASPQALRDRAGELEKDAARLRHVAKLVHQRRIEQELQKLFEVKDPDVDLVHAALLLAKLDNEELEIEPYRKLVEGMSAELRSRLGPKPTDAARLDALVKYLFEELGFHGSQLEYYHRANSYLNEVLDDREGIPITLSVVFIELARRIDLPAVGVGVPGHFVVQVNSREGQPSLVDPFHGGKTITRAEAATLAGRPLRDSELAPASKHAVIVRMLHNLLGAAQREQDLPSIARYLDVILTLDTDSAPDHWMRAVLRFQTGQPQGAIEDLDWLIARDPSDVDMAAVRELREILRRNEPR